MEFLSKLEKELIKDNKIIAGVDEVGRGSLIGPVVTCAFIIDNSFNIYVKDSKVLSEKKRNEIFLDLISRNTNFSLGLSTHEEIDELNILDATRLAMLRAVNNLKIKPNILLIDGNQKINSDIKLICIPKGDTICKSIAAASIIAKVIRDFIMKRISSLYPYYSLDKNKGYATPYHKESLRTFGYSPIHRKTFKY